MVSSRLCSNARVTSRSVQSAVYLFSPRLDTTVLNAEESEPAPIRWPKEVAKGIKYSSTSRGGTLCR